MSSKHVRVGYDDFRQIAPGAYDALLALGKAAEQSGLDKGLIELVKLRASQINGCAFCVQHHLNVARRLGVPAVKLDLVAAWRDAGVFSEREHAALAWTECLTALSDTTSDAAYVGVREHFAQSEIVLLSVAIAAINAWNRLGAGLRFAPPAPNKAGA